MQRSVSRKPPMGWSFTIKEVSACVYQVRGVGPDGLVMERTGLDDQDLLDQLIADAWKLAD